MRGKIFLRQLLGIGIFTCGNFIEESSVEERYRILEGDWLPVKFEHANNS